MSRRRISRLGLVLVVLAALASHGASAAVAAPQWLLDVNTNTNAAPGGTIDYHLQIINIGDEEADGTGSDPIVFTAALPSDVSASKVEMSFLALGYFDASVFGWSCSGDGPEAPGVLGAQNLSCSLAQGFPARTSNAPTGLPIVRAEVAPGAAAGSREAAFTLAGGAAAPVARTELTRISAEPPRFGIDMFDGAIAADAAATPDTQAGGHPFAVSTTIDFNSGMHPNPFFGDLWPVASPKNVEVDLPPGLIGNPTAAERCDGAELSAGACPPEAQVGTTVIRLNGQGSGNVGGPVPVYNLEPPPDSPARFGFNIAGVITTLDAQLRSDGDYGVTIKARNLPQGLSYTGTTVTFWGDPADEAHLHERSCPTRTDPPEYTRDNPSCPSDAPPAAFLRNPTSCSPPGEGLPWALRMDSWRQPGEIVSAGYRSHAPPGYPLAPEKWGPELGITDCDEVPFEPSFKAAPEEPARGGAPSAFDFELAMPQTTDPDAIAQADLKRAVVTLPAGVRLSPSAANGLGACAPAQIGLHTLSDPECPESSKIGDASLTTPLLEEDLSGAVYLGKPLENPFGSLLSLYLVLEGQGVVLKLPGKVEADPQTGQLTASFDDNPQAPFTSLRLQLAEGPRAPLVLPDRCGSYETTATLTPWSGNAPVKLASSFQVSQCGAGGFDPKFAAGAANPVAGSFSPFNLRLSRDDSSQRLGGLSATLPPGLLAQLKGIPYCSDAALAAVSGALGTGAAQIEAPGCPAQSRVGTVTVGAGAGPNPFYTSAARAYLAGPYRGAPLSLAVIAPAVAGPFDLGSVVVRNALRVDPESARVTAVADPLPQILHGVPLDLRDIRVQLDRPGFTLNPTSCREMAVEATITSAQGAVAQRSERFQVGDCKRLAFKPRLSLRLKGATARSGFPALRATLRMPKARGANIARVQVELPRSEFLAQSHIRTICTRVQFAARQCPKGSVYGYARAFTPLLDQPLQGPVYLRSSDNPLPDLVARLDGQIEVDLVGRIDSKRGGGIRTTFASVPDAPVSKFVLTMQGGRKGLLENSRNLCRSTSRALVLADGQNGKTWDSAPVVKPDCGKGRGGGGKR